jgi:ATP-dependent Zn protease
VKRRLIQVDNFRARCTARFRALPRRAKRIVVAQFLVVALLFTGLTRNAVVNSSNNNIGSSRMPIEISYSSFMNLVENQRDGSVPILNQVRIGSDRIAFRLYKTTAENSNEEDNLPWIKAPKTFGKRQNAQNPQEQQHELQPYLTAYTRKVSAAPELVQALRLNDISFAAAPAPRANSVAVAIRTAVLGFYFLILFKLYKTVSGNGGGGKGDVPGKLAQTSDLPMASFDDIQGIDGAKVEVMELVDTLRNPDKYAILGARAPTGLLVCLFVFESGSGRLFLLRMLDTLFPLASNTNIFCRLLYFSIAGWSTWYRYVI